MKNFNYSHTRHNHCNTNSLIKIHVFWFLISISISYKYVHCKITFSHNNELKSALSLLSTCMHTELPINSFKKNSHNIVFMNIFIFGGRASQISMTCDCCSMLKWKRATIEHENKTGVHIQSTLSNEHDRVHKALLAYFTNLWVRTDLCCE